MLGAAYCRPFRLPPAEAPRYLAIETRSDPMGPMKKHHVEMYNPQLLHPTKRDNVFIWAAHDLREVRNWEFIVFCFGLFGGQWLCRSGVNIFRFISDSVNSRALCAIVQPGIPLFSRA